MKYKLNALLDFDEEIVELDDDLTKEEIEEQLYEYVMSFFEWNYQEVEEEKN